MSRRDTLGGLADMTLPPEGGAWEAEHRWGESGLTPPPERSEADAYRMSGLAAMDRYAPSTFRDIDRAEIMDKHGGTNIHGMALPPPSPGEPKAWFDTIVGETPADALVNLGLGGTGRLAKGALALGGLFKLTDPAEAGKLPRGPKGMGGVLKTGGDDLAVKNWVPPFPEYAERYPPVGPGTLAIDPKTKKEYLAKELTPEAVAFQKARAKIADDMAANGYQPYFDVSKRAHVDPTHYPPNVDTTTIIPKKQATIDKHMEKIGSEEARERLRAAYQRGTELPNTADWYAMKQLEDEFIKELGPEAGRKAFQDRIATSMAATTGGADPTSNWMMAHYGNYLRATGQPYPTAAHEMPFPIGGRYASGNMAMHKKIFDEGGFAALGEGNPKRHNFAQDFTGNRRAATMDEQMTSGMTPGVNMPPVGTYGLYEKVLAEEAAKVGVQPQNYQDVGWAGFKNLKDPSYTAGQPFIQTINESIERTHRLTGMPKDEIVRRGIIKGEIPLYAVMGAVGMGALADQKGYAP
jgi:hypothetical protein